MQKCSSSDEHVAVETLCGNQNFSTIILVHDRRWLVSWEVGGNKRGKLITNKNTVLRIQPYCWCYSCNVVVSVLGSSRVVWLELLICKRVCVFFYCSSWLTRIRNAIKNNVIMVKPYYSWCNL